MRLIDADAIPYDEDCTVWPNGAVDRWYSALKSDIDAMPTIDPVKHGKWQVGSGGFVCCSECGERATWNHIRNNTFTNYCPKCGAKMDGDMNATD